MEYRSIARLGPKNLFIEGLKMAHEVFDTKFSKLGPSIKMVMCTNSSTFSTLKASRQMKNKYNDIIWITPPHFGRILVPKSLY